MFVKISTVKIAVITGDGRCLVINKAVREKDHHHHHHHHLDTPGSDLASSELSD